MQRQARRRRLESMLGKEHRISQATLKIREILVEQQQS